MNDILVLERQKIMKYPHTKKIETLQKAYDFLEHIEDMMFVQQDKHTPDTSYVDRKTFKKALKK